MNDPHGGPNEWMTIGSSSEQGSLLVNRKTQVKDALTLYSKVTFFTHLV